jgi:FlaA1/EpsC-like NDP-sugar epimerase
MTSKQPSSWRLGSAERRALLLAGDFSVGLLALAISLAFWAASARWYGFSWRFLRELVDPWFYLLPLAWMLLLVDLYDVHKSANWRRTVRGVAVSALLGFGIYAVVYIFSEPGSLPRQGVAVFLISASLLTLLWRWVYIRVFTGEQFRRRVLLVGAGTAGQMLLRVIRGKQPPPFDLVGVLDDDPDKQDETIEGYPVLAGSDRLLEIVAEQEITDLIVAISGTMQGSTFQALLDAQERGVLITRMPVVYEELQQRVPIQILEADWLLRSFADETRVSGFYELIKRGMDIIGALLGIFILLLMLPVIGLATLLDDGWPIFYLQTSLGRGGKRYEIIKYDQGCRAGRHPALGQRER